MNKSAFEIDDNIAIYDGYTDGTQRNYISSIKAFCRK